MIGAQDVEEMQLNIGGGHAIYTGGAKGTDELAEEMAKHFGMQVEVIVPPNHPRADYVSPSTVEVLVLANPHLHQAAQKLCKRVPTHFYTLQLLQRNYQGCQTSQRGNRLDRAIGFGSRQRRLPV